MTLTVSFEFFPPKTAQMEEQLWAALRRLAPLQPAFVSVTYGAGGTTRERTHATVARIARESALKPAAHLTCVGATRAEVDAVIAGYWEAGVRHIVALRGDMPDMARPYRPHPEGYQSTAELVAGIRRIAPFEVSVSAYPEGHPESPDIASDLDTLKAKVAAGATRAITQFAFETQAHLRLRDRAASAGIAIPIVPGIMPTTNFKGVERMSERCGASVPAWLRARYAGLEEDLEVRKLIAAAVAADQVAQLAREGFSQFHFYTLNQADLTYAVCRILGIHPVSA